MSSFVVHAIEKETLYFRMQICLTTLADIIRWHPRKHASNDESSRVGWKRD